MTVCETLPQPVVWQQENKAYEKPEDKDLSHDFAHFKRLYQLKRHLGQGGFGIVYSGTRIADGFPVAVKFVSRKKVPNWSELDGRNVPLEIALLSHCQAERIKGVVRMLDWYERRDGFLVVMERPKKCQDLFDYINKKQALNETLARAFFKQVVDVAIALEDAGIVHRDIKDENLIIDLTTNTVKLIDFGSGTFLKAHVNGYLTDMQGTRLCAPPEYFTELKYTAGDATVWSLGILLYCMLFGDIPFHSDEEIIEARLHICRIATIGQPCQELLRRCLAVDPKTRIKLREIRKYSWLQ